MHCLFPACFPSCLFVWVSFCSNGDGCLWCDVGSSGILLQSGADFVLFNFFSPIVIFILKLFTVLLLSEAVPCQSKSWASRTVRTPCASLCPRYGVEKRCSSWPLKTYSLDKALGAEIAPVQKSPDRYNCLPCFRVSHMNSCCLLVIYEDGGDLESMHGIIDISLAAAANLPTFSRFYTVKNSFSTWMNGQGTTWILINIDRNHPPISCSDKTMMMKKGSRSQPTPCFTLKIELCFDGVSQMVELESSFSFQTQGTGAAARVPKGGLPHLWAGKRLGFCRHWSQQSGTLQNPASLPLVPTWEQVLAKNEACSTSCQNRWTLPFLTDIYEKLAWVNISLFDQGRWFIFKVHLLCICGKLPWNTVALGSDFMNARLGAPLLSLIQW